MIQSQLEELFSLKDKVIVLTGAGGVIAGEIAWHLARCKAKIVVLDISLDAGQARTELIKQEGFDAIALQADVLDKASLEEACSIVMEKYGTIDGLVNGAGGNQKKATTSEELFFFDLHAEAINNVFDLNCMGTMLACQVFGREMVKQKSGSASIGTLVDFINVFHRHLSGIIVQQSGYGCCGFRHGVYGFFGNVDVA